MKKQRKTKKTLKKKGGYRGYLQLVENCTSRGCGDGLDCGVCTLDFAQLLSDKGKGILHENTKGKGFRDEAFINEVNKMIPHIQANFKFLGQRERGLKYLPNPEDPNWATSVSVCLDNIFKEIEPGEFAFGKWNIGEAKGWQMRFLGGGGHLFIWAKNEKGEGMFICPQTNTIRVGITDILEYIKTRVWEDPNSETGYKWLIDLGILNDQNLTFEPRAFYYDPSKNEGKDTNHEFEQKTNHLKQGDKVYVRLKTVQERPFNIGDIVKLGGIPGFFMKDYGKEGKILSISKEGGRTVFLNVEINGLIHGLVTPGQILEHWVEGKVGGTRPPQPNSYYTIGGITTK